MLKEKGANAAKNAEMQKFIEAANAPRSVKVDGSLSNSGSVLDQPEQTGRIPPNIQPRPPPLPVVGSQWGKESDPVLNDFSKWAKNYADTPPDA